MSYDCLPDSSVASSSRRVPPATVKVSTGSIPVDYGCFFGFRGEVKCLPSDGGRDPTVVDLDRGPEFRENL